jgi:5'-3' exonuclease
MGGSQLHKAFEGASHRVSLNVFGSNKVLAVDVSILVHKWVFSNNEAAYRFVRFDEMDQLVSLFREVVNWLLTANTTYIMVFDGVCPGKADLNRNRAAAARVARKRMMELLGQNDINMAQVYAEATKAVQRTRALQLAFINVLRNLGVSYIVAEEEADAQIGLLYRRGLVYAAVSEDADLYAHGVRRLVYEIRRQTFVWSVVDLELTDLTQHSTDERQNAQPKLRTAHMSSAPLSGRRHVHGSARVSSRQDGRDACRLFVCKHCCSALHASRRERGAVG